MNTEERTRAQYDMVETIGRMYEKQLFGQIPGRIMGLLSVMDKEQFTFEEIVDELKISKSSASNALQILEAHKMIEYFNIPGDRKRYFRIRKSDKFAIIDEHQVKLKMSRDLFQSILELKTDKETANSVFIKDVIDLLTVFLDKFEEIKSEYLNKK